MSKAKSQSIEIPKGVSVNLEGRKLSFSGEKGSLEKEIPADIEIKVDGGQISLAHVKSDKQ